MQVNGLRVLIPVALPAVVTALVWLALHRRCARGGRAGSNLAWALISVLVVGCVVAIASVGVLVAPAVALLAGAAYLTPSGDRRERRRQHV